MDEFLAKWEDDEFKSFVIVTVFAVIVMVYLYRRYRRIKKDSDYGKPSEVLEYDNYLELLIIVIFMILGVLTQIGVINF